MFFSFDENDYNQDIFFLNNEMPEFFRLFSENKKNYSIGGAHNEEIQIFLPININKNSYENFSENLSNIELDEDKNINPHCFDQNDEDNYIKNIIKEKSLKEISGSFSTNMTSEKNGKFEIKSQKAFIIENKSLQNNCLPNYWRFDMAKKHWKSNISDYATKYINNLINQSDLPKGIKKYIHKPNSSKFTSNIKVSDNFYFLEYKLIDIFTLGSSKNNLQEKNKRNISEILKYFEKIGFNNVSENMRKIKAFFEMTYEDLIRKFYDSRKFIEFKSNRKTIFFDKNFIEQEGFSLLKNYGLINLFKMINKKRKRD